MPKLRFCGPKSEVSSDLAIVFFVAAGIAAVRFDLPDFGIVLPRGLATPPTLLRRRSECMQNSPLRHATQQAVPEGQ